MIDRLLKQLRRHEGFVPTAYQDHLGYWTIGFGRLIDERRGGGLTEAECEYLLRNDVLKCEAQLETITAFNKLDDVRQASLVNMCFQLGFNGLKAFKKMWSALERFDFETAADEALDSRWAKQTPDRALEIAAQLRTGVMRG